MVIAGSGAREEMFPGSDLDLSPVTDVDQQGVVVLFEFVKYVEKRLKATMDYLKIKLGLPHELGLGPDTGVFGFAKTPELLAKKVLEMQNTAQDATEIYGSPGSAGLAKRFERERDAQGTQKHAPRQLQGLLLEFPDAIPRQWTRSTSRRASCGSRRLSCATCRSSSESRRRIRSIALARLSRPDTWTARSVPAWFVHLT